MTVQLYEVSSGAMIIADVVVNQTDYSITITITAGNAASLAAGTYRVVAIG